jgi:hypothetical protein
MSAIPAKLISLKTLSQVPVSEYADILPPADLTNTQQRAGFFRLLRQKSKQSAVSSVRSSTTRELAFNAAVWMNFPKTMNKPVSLWLSYKDGSGENTILVDEHLMIDSCSAMLSGSVTLRVKGHLEYLHACCGGISKDDSFQIEELYVRRQRQFEHQTGLESRRLMAS